MAPRVTATLLMLLGLCVGCLMARERSRTSVNDIRFEGNHTLDRNELLSQMKLRPDKLFSSTAFSRFKLADDERALVRYYRSVGFIDVRVSSVVVREGVRRGRVDLEFRIDEGRRVLVGSITVTANPVVADTVPSFLRTALDSPLVESWLVDDGETIRDSLRASGYLAAMVEVATKIDSTRYRAAVTFVTSVGPKVIVGDITIDGLATVREKVVERELSFARGDTLTTHAMQRSARRLYRTGLFSFARIEPRLDETADTLPPRDTVVPVTVTLDQTDYFLFEAGVGYSSDERLATSTRFAYANLFRRGHRVVLDGRFGSIEQGFALSYVTPWLFVVPLRTEVSAFYLRHDTLVFTPALGYSGEFTGFSVALGQTFNGTLAYRTLFRYENVLRLSAPSLDLLPTDVPTKNTRSLAGELIYDRRDDIFVPTKGFYGAASAELAGIFSGAVNQFVKTTLDLRGYTAIGTYLYFAFGIELGWAGPYGASQVVPPQEQFYAGGPNSVRGYDIDRLVVSDGEPLGGNALLVAHLLELRFPLGWWLYGAAFVDAGYVWPDLKSVAFGDIKVGAGPGLRLVTPLGMFRFDVGFKVNDPDRDPVEYYFVFGSAL